MVYGEPEEIVTGDYVDVRGWLRVTDGNYFFPETGLATLGDVSIESGGVTRRGKHGSHLPLSVTAQEFCSAPEIYGGNLVAMGDLSITSQITTGDGDTFGWFYGAGDSILVYLDKDTGCSLEEDPEGCFTITGVVVRMKTPAGFTDSPAWCIAPRWMNDIESESSYSDVRQRMLGEIKADFSDQD